MFAAAAIFAQMVFDKACDVAKFIATRALLLSLLAIGLPWVLKGVLMWGFDWVLTYGRVFGDQIMSYISAQAGSQTIAIHLSGIGGYLAEQTGLIDYCAIIITGWGLYWTVAVLAKTPRML